MWGSAFIFSIYYRYTRQLCLGVVTASVSSTVYIDALLARVLPKVLESMCGLSFTIM